MATIKVGDGSGGVVEYLLSGKKAGRDFGREDADDRVVLNGDLSLLQLAIDAVPGAIESKKYLHLSLNFAEQHLAPEVIEAIDRDMREFFSAGYRDGELMIYSEAHLPKLKSYVGKNGETVTRLPHIHYVIPMVNLVTGEKVNPLGFWTAHYGAAASTVDLVNAFRDSLNEKYGLISPLDRPRALGGKVPVLDRAKDRDAGDPVKNRSGVIRTLAQAVLDKNISTVADLKAEAEKFGKVTTASFKGRSILRVETLGGVVARLKDRVFSKEFLALPLAEKLREVGRSLKAGYREVLDLPGDAGQSLVSADWRRRAREIRYFNPNGKWFKDVYKGLDDGARDNVLNAIEAGGYVEGYSKKGDAAPDLRLLSIDGALAISPKALDAVLAGDAGATSTLLADIFAHQSTLTQEEFQRRLVGAVGGESFDAVLEMVGASPAFRVLGERVTTTWILEQERYIADAARMLSDAGARGGFVSNTEGLNKGQAGALSALCSDARLVMVSGAAGTGKSFTLKRFAQAAGDAGFKVVGGATQGKTAQDLQAGTGISSSTIAGLLSRIDKGAGRGGLVLDARTIVVIDEAGMVGSADSARLFKAVAESGASLRLVGDARQLASVAYGGVFGELFKAHGGAEITEIVRQRDEAHRALSMAFSRGDAAEALTGYRDAGAIVRTTDEFDTLVRAAGQYLADKKQGAACLICKTNQQRHELNALVRDALIDRRQIDPASAVTLVSEVAGRVRPLPVAVGESIITMAPARVGKTRIANGSAGVVEEIREGCAVVRFAGVDDPVEIEAGTGIALDYGYAITSYKAQGMTFDRATVVLDRGMSANELYVAGTRHRDAVTFLTDDPGAILSGIRAQQKAFTGLRDTPESSETAIDSIVEKMRIERLIEGMVSRKSGADLNADLSAQRLLDRLAVTHGVRDGTYRVVEGNRIRAGRRELTVTEFLVREMHLDLVTQALPVARECLRQQLLDAHVRGAMSADERREIAGFNKVRIEEARQLALTAEIKAQQSPLDPVASRAAASEAKARYAEAKSLPMTEVKKLVEAARREKADECRDSHVGGVADAVPLLVAGPVPAPPAPAPGMSHDEFVRHLQGVAQTPGAEVPALVVEAEEVGAVGRGRMR